MRTADKADPDPELMTVALRIWPAMLIITLTNLTFLVYIAGISGGYVFIVIFVNFLATYVVLSKTIKVTQKEAFGDRKEQEEVPRLSVENEKNAPSEDKEESEGAAIEMSILAADTSKDIESGEEEQQTEAKTEDKKEADVTQMPPPPPTEMPDMAAGTNEDVEECQTEAKTENNEEAEMSPPPPSLEMPDTSKDMESQKVEKTEEMLENKSKDEKPRKEKKAGQGEEESFLFAASVCSTWIPSVVGDPEQRFFLKAGEPLQCIGPSVVSSNTLHLSKFPRCCEPRHKEFLPCRCDPPRHLWDP